MDDIPAGFWKWATGGLLGLVLSGAGAIGSLFRWHASRFSVEIKDVHDRIDKMDACHKGSVDDLWTVLNTERDAASRARERNFQRLEQTPTRDEMQHGFDRLEALIRATKQ